MVLDLDLPRVPGMKVLRHTVAEHPQVMVVILSGKGTIKTAVEATRLGAYDFLEKPVAVERTLLTIRPCPGEKQPATPTRVMVF